MEINFYSLDTSLNKTLPILLQKIIDNKERAVIFSKDSEKTSQIDEELWTFAKIKFIPHGTSKDGNEDKQPIYLTSTAKNPNKAEILILLDEVEESFLNTFSKIIYMFEEQNSEEVEKAKILWNKFKGLGHSLYCLKKDLNGKWQKFNELV